MYINQIVHKMTTFYFSQSLADELLIFAAPQRNTAPNSAELCVKPKTKLSFGVTSLNNTLTNLVKNR